MSEPKIYFVLEVPEGLPELRPLLSCEPKTQEEFDAVVEACGGPSAFTYFSETAAHAKLAGGGTLLLYAPGPRLPLARPIAPAIASLQERANP